MQSGWTDNNNNNHFNARNVIIFQFVLSNMFNIIIRSHSMHQPRILILKMTSFLLKTILAIVSLCNLIRSSAFVIKYFNLRIIHKRSGIIIINATNGLSLYDINYKE